MERRKIMDRRSGEDRRGDGNGVEELLGQYSGSVHDEVTFGGSNYLDVLLDNNIEAEVLDFDGWMRAMEKNSRAVATLCIAMRDELVELRREISLMSRSVYSMAAERK